MDRLNIVEEEFPIFFLDCNESFRKLTENEKKYAFELVNAGWFGGLIDLVQCSPESPGIFLVAQKFFKNHSLQEIEALFKNLNYDDKDLKNFLNYFALFYDNLGNYRSFGDSKFIPRLEEQKFNNVIMSTVIYKNDKEFQDIFNKVRSSIYSLTGRNKQFGLGNDGISTYYSYNCSLEDAKIVQKYLDENNISAYNTRVFKTFVNGVIKYEVRQASSLINEERELTIQIPVENVIVKLTSGDYRELMELMVKELIKAGESALNETEKRMIKYYINSFETGSIDDHKAGSRLWIMDVGPVVENYIGFIESYRDPLGVRGEFEAFIAVVNKDMSAKFTKLVNSAPSILKELPWPKEYEKDRFLKPDFTSLDIINFPVSGIPVGINIPNYDEIRQDEGFKNVSLGNVLKSRFKDPKTNFIAPEDKELFVAYAAESFDLQVGLHELIGHGSGKLFKSEDRGIEDILKGGSIKSWYKANETWDSVFTTIASPFEECRAESVGLYLCSLPIMADIFGYKNEDHSSNISYINWLSMIKSSLLSMEFYTPEQQRWRQAHCQARFVILQVLLEAGNGFVKIEKFTSDDGKPDLKIRLDRSKIENIGRPAMGKFLKSLQYFKSTANHSEGRVFFNKYSILNEEFLQLREIVLDRKLPRGSVVQSVLRDNPFTILEYQNTAYGMIESFIDRFSGQYGDRACKALHDIWIRDIPHFT